MHWKTGFAVKLIALLSLTLALSSQAALPPEVIVNRPLSADDSRYVYPEALLNKVLAQSLGAKAPAVVQSDSAMSRDRVFRELQRGQLIHVMAEAPKPGWEEELIPVRIPIRKGVQGYRLFLINATFQPQMDRIRTLADLQHYPTGSGAQWSTLRVLRDAGFEVYTSPNYEGLFEMLSRQRFQTFSRGLNEAYRELEQFSPRYPGLAVDRAVALYIPLPTYFFVTPRYPELATAIEEGLEQMIASDSFDAFFCDHHRADIERARLADRTLFCLPNANLSPQTPLAREALWRSEACGLEPRRDCGNLEEMARP